MPAPTLKCSCGESVFYMEEIHKLEPSFERLDVARLSCVFCGKMYMKYRDRNAWAITTMPSIKAQEALKKAARVKQAAPPAPGELARVIEFTPIPELQAEPCATDSVSAEVLTSPSTPSNQP